MDRRLARIRLVTERYNELQGLRRAIAGAMLAATGGGLLIAHAGRRSVLTALVLTFAAMIPSQWLLSRYYAARFGRIVVPPPRKQGIWLLAAMAIVLAITGYAFDSGQFAGPFMIGVGAALWIAIRDWPLRGYHLLGAVVTGVAAVLQLLAPDSDAMPRAQATSFLLVGLAYIPIGLLDHRLLASVMRTQQRNPALLQQE